MNIVNIFFISSMQIYNLKPMPYLNDIISVIDPKNMKVYCIFSLKKTRYLNK